MKHIFIKGSNQGRPTLLLLHGTGGNEQDLLPLANIIDREANVLSVRGFNLPHEGIKSLFR